MAESQKCQNLFVTDCQRSTSVLNWQTFMQVVSSVYAGNNSKKGNSNEHILIRPLVRHLCSRGPWLLFTGHSELTFSTFRKSSHPHFRSWASVVTLFGSKLCPVSLCLSFVRMHCRVDFSYLFSSFSACFADVIMSLHNVCIVFVDDPALIVCRCVVFGCHSHVCQVIAAKNCLYA